MWRTFQSALCKDKQMNVLADEDRWQQEHRLLPSDLLTYISIE
jgi:hypothetical protein